jgi:hypothetical protein
MELTREEELFYCFAPVLVTFNEWKQHPEKFLLGTDMDRYLHEMRQYYKVTVGEWDTIMKRFEER